MYFCMDGVEASFYCTHTLISMNIVKYHLWFIFCHHNIVNLDHTLDYTEPRCQNTENNAKTGSAAFKQFKKCQYFGSNENSQKNIENTLF